MVVIALYYHHTVKYFLQFRPWQMAALFTSVKQLSITSKKKKKRTKTISCTWSWPSGWCIGLRSRLHGFDAQLGYLHDACSTLPQKFSAAIKLLEITKKKKTITIGKTTRLLRRLCSLKRCNHFEVGKLWLAVVTLYSFAKVLQNASALMSAC